MSLIPVAFRKSRTYTPPAEKISQQRAKSKVNPIAALFSPFRIITGARMRNSREFARRRGRRLSGRSSRRLGKWKSESLSRSLAPPPPWRGHNLKSRRRRGYNGAGDASSRYIRLYFKCSAPRRHCVWVAVCACVSECARDRFSAAYWRFRIRLQASRISRSLFRSYREVCEAGF